MAAIEPGRVCYKIAGRNAGEKVVVLESPKGHMVEIATFYGKKKKYNIRHLFPSKEKVDVKSLKIAKKTAKEKEEKEGERKKTGEKGKGEKRRQKAAKKGKTKIKTRKKKK